MRRASSGLSCLLAIDKPLGLSSHDVVNRVRRALGERRVGHAGTLDPAASGVLVVGVGQATRLLGLLTLDDKRYDARIAFGAETTTDDAEGDVTVRAEVPERLAEPAVAEVVLASLVGTCEQVPPSFSAISVDGKRSYARARAGEAVELPARTVTIYDASLIRVTHDGDTLCWDCSLHVSKGTYVRSIARDLGRSMGTAAHLSGLRRTASGCVDERSCLTLEQLREFGPQRVMAHALNPIRALGMPERRLSPEELAHVSVGRRIAPGQVMCPDGSRRSPANGERVALTANGMLMGVWESREGRLASVSTFPDGVAGVAL